MKKQIYDFVVKDEDHLDVSLSKYQGQVMLILNSATECGFTDQYDLLQPLYDRYRKQGFIILDFPCNQFGGQSPMDIKEIINYCDIEYEITFPILNKIDVNGPAAEPLFAFLKSDHPFMGFDPQHPFSAMFAKMSEHLPTPGETTDIQWNFTKFLINRQGHVMGRFEPTAEFSLIEEEIKKLL